MTPQPEQPRLRMFAGPNGSGKTTVQRIIARQYAPDFLGVVVNPDDLEETISRDGRLPLGPFRVNATEREVGEAFSNSAFLKLQNLADAAKIIRCDGSEIDFSGLSMNSYYASVLSDFLRRKLIVERISFSFETVMSEPGKVRVLAEAQNSDFRTYLYFVATEDPQINVVRVARRVAEGGHDVPKQKILSRYDRSLSMARDAVRHTDRAYFFDTSGDAPLLVAEITDGKRLELRCQQIPNWFKTHIWDKF